MLKNEAGRDKKHLFFLLGLILFNIIVCHFFISILINCLFSKNMLCMGDLLCIISLLSSKTRFRNFLFWEVRLVKNIIVNIPTFNYCSGNWKVCICFRESKKKILGKFFIFGIVLKNLPVKEIHIIMSSSKVGEGAEVTPTPKQKLMFLVWSVCKCCSQ